LEFFNGNTSLGSFTGANVLANPNGDQGVNGTRYVNITSTLKFDKVVASSSQYAFEFDNVAYGNYNNGSFDPVPEPASIAMWSLGALGMMFAGRKRRQMKLAA
jgi:hypothetical protein